MKTTTTLSVSALFCAICATSAAAQHSIIFSLDSDEVTLINGNGLVEAGLVFEMRVALLRSHVAEAEGRDAALA